MNNVSSDSLYLVFSCLSSCLSLDDVVNLSWTSKAIRRSLHSCWDRQKRETGFHNLVTREKTLSSEVINASGQLQKLRIELLTLLWKHHSSSKSCFKTEIEIRKIIDNLLSRQRSGYFGVIPDKLRNNLKFLTSDSLGMVRAEPCRYCIDSPLDWDGEVTNRETVMRTSGDTAGSCRTNFTNFCGNEADIDFIMRNIKDSELTAAQQSDNMMKCPKDTKQDDDNVTASVLQKFPAKCDHCLYHLDIKSWSSDDDVDSDIGYECYIDDVREESSY